MNSIKPSSNLFFLNRLSRQQIQHRRQKELGVISLFDDEFIVTNLFSWLEANDLKTIHDMNFSLSALSSYENLWKNLYLNHYRSLLESDCFDFEGSWKHLLLKILQLKTEEYKQQAVYYSDFLYRPFLYRFGSMDTVVNRLQELSTSCTVFKENNLSVEEFIQAFEKTLTPLKIASNLLNEWRIAKAWSTCEIKESELNLGQHSSVPETLQTIVRVGEMNISLKEFLKYSRNCENEENKLYLFDCNILKNEDHFKNLFQTPKYFRGRDILNKMGSLRPDHSWIIAGTTYTYSKWHIDPNFTHAWNAVVSGRKLWILLPFECVPCGVIPSKDLSTVTQPVSLAEWFTNFLDLTLESYGKKVVFTVAKPGDIVYVPSRWWHCVVNLEPTVAITENYIAKSNLERALRMMRDSPHLISGIDSSRNKHEFYEDFISCLRETKDNDVMQILEHLKKNDAKSRICWTEVKKQKREGFSFSFFTSI